MLTIDFWSLLIFGILIFVFLFIIACSLYDEFSAQFKNINKEN